MRKFLQIAAVGGAALLLVSLVLAPFLIYEFGIPWLPSQPQASNSQLALVYVIDAPLIGAAGWLLITICKYLPGWQNSSSGLTPKPQSTRLSRSQAIPTAHNDPIVIGGGREKNNVYGGVTIFLGAFFAFGGGILALYGQQENARATGLPLLIIGLITLFIGIIVWFFGERRPCLKIGSEGIAYSKKDRLFIPWDEMSNVYVDISIFFPYLYVILKTNSRLHFLEPIKSRYENGAIVICGVSNSSISIIPKH